MTFLNLLEYIGTIAFAISGAMVGIENRMDIFGVVMLGLTTAVGGGALRDIFAHIDLAIFTRHFYACAAIIGSITSFFLFKINDNLSIIVTFFVIFTLRMLAIKYKWNLPKAK